MRLLFQLQGQYCFSLTTKQQIIQAIIWLTLEFNPKRSQTRLSLRAAEGSTHQTHGLFVCASLLLTCWKLQVMIYSERLHAREAAAEEEKKLGEGIVSL